MPAGAQVVSLFEPHTAIIRKGKLRRPTECGRAGWRAEVDGDGIAVTGRAGGVGRIDAIVIRRAVDRRGVGIGRDVRSRTADLSEAQIIRRALDKEAALVRCVIGPI